MVPPDKYTLLYIKNPFHRLLRKRLEHKSLEYSEFFEEELKRESEFVTYDGVDVRTTRSPELWSKLNNSKNTAQSKNKYPGLVADRKGEHFGLYNTYTTRPWIEFKYHDDISKNTFSDLMISAAENYKSTGKTIDLFWSGGIDSTAVLLALNEICPKQLHVIIGGWKPLEYPELYNKLVKHLDHTLDVSGNLFGLSQIDKHILCTACEADQMFGSSAGFLRGNRQFYNPKGKNYKRLAQAWNYKRRYRLVNTSWRYLSHYTGGRFPIENYKNFYMEPELEKWAVNLVWNGEMVWYDWQSGGKDWWNPVWEDPYDHYRNCKMDLRKFVYSYTKDTYHSFEKPKERSAFSGFDYKSMVETSKNFWRNWAVTKSGEVITKESMSDYDLTKFFHNPPSI